MVQAFGPLTLGLTAVSLAVSAAGVWMSIRLAHRVGVMDVPNERSSHSLPMPRMGGVPMVAAALLPFGCWAWLGTGEMFSAKGLPHTMIFALAMSVLGLWDDLRSLSPLFRFLVQFVAAILVCWYALYLFPIFLLGGWALPAVACILAGAFWIVWMLNLYNFMDGIDGLAGGEAAVSSSFFYLVFASQGESGWAVANLFIAAASMGFLVFNWPPARVFMGDAGSAFLGAFYGTQSVIAALSTPVPFTVLVLPFANFIMDTSVTLIRRMWLGEKWYKPHRSHFYQRMTGLGMSHAKVTGCELISIIFSCAAAAIFLSSNNYYTRLGIMLGVPICFIIMGIWIRSREQTLQFSHKT
jgi:Fuc2NAc and GlcNAc transferase